MCILKEVRFGINRRAHVILKELSRLEGVPMSYIMRGIMYHGIQEKIRKLDEVERNEIIEKTKQTNL